jgi:hypothetical protein
VDPVDLGPAGGRFETFDVNQRFVVVRDDEGYGVWRLEELDEGAPIERFADDERGYEAARSRYKELTDRARRDVWLRWLRMVVVIAAIMWVLSSGLSALLFLQVGFDTFEGSGTFQTLVRWSQLISLVAQPMTLGGSAVYVILWLEGRRNR